MMFAWLKKLFRSSERNGNSTRICLICGKSFTLPEDVQSWPDLCTECRAKLPGPQQITATCRRCGKNYIFSIADRYWPRLCPDCRARHTERV